MYPEALDLASRSPCDCEPKTLTRAAREFLEVQPEFALGSGMLALRWLASGHGYEITAADVWAAYQATMRAAQRVKRADATKDQVRRLFGQTPGSFAAGILRQKLGSSSSGRLVKTFK